MNECCQKWFLNLKNDDWKVRCSVVEEISSLSDTSQVLAVICLLEKENWIVREAVSSGLSCSRNENVIAAVEESMTRYPWFLPYALRILRRVGRVPAFHSFRAGVSSKDPYIRRAALRALGHLDDPEAVPLLESSLGDADYRIRRTAAMVLGTIGSLNSLPCLSCHLDDPDLSVRYAVQVAMQQIQKL